MSLTNCTFTGYIRREGWSPNRKPDLRRRAEGEGTFTWDVDTDPNLSIYGSGSLYLVSKCVFFDQTPV